MTFQSGMDAQDSKQAYDAYVQEFKCSARNYSDEVLLKIKLKRLGYYGVRLDDEVRYIKESA